jgi:hypothetical protein
VRASSSWIEGRVLWPSEVEQRFNEAPLPCPFCRSQSIGLHLGPSPHMTCGGCGADGPTLEGPRDTLEERQWLALQKWNAR